MKRPLLVAERITARRRLFQVSGVGWSATRYAWLSPASWISLGLAMAVAGRAHTDLLGVALAGVGYGGVLYSANVIHSLGHVVAGHIAGVPVETVLLTSTRDVILYSQPGAAAPRRRRLVRAIGGPAANLALGCALMLADHVARVPAIRTAGLVNLGVALWTLMPVPSLDGWVIRDFVMRSRSEASHG